MNRLSTFARGAATAARSPVVAFAVLTAAIYAYAAVWLKHAFSGFQPNPFDGALQLVAHNFMARGFVPYRDFYFMYPPGLPLLTSSLLSGEAFFQRNLLVASLLVALHAVALVIVWRNVRDQHLRPLVSAIFLTALTVNLEKIQLDPLALAIAVLGVLACTVGRASRSRTGLYRIALMSILPWFRWDWAAFLMLIQLCWLAAVVSIAGLRRTGAINAELKRQVAAQICGTLVGFATLFFYLWSHDTLAVALDSFVRIPLVTGPFRSLPMPLPQRLTRPNSLFYTSLLLIVGATAGLLVGYRCRKLSGGELWSALLVVALPLAFLPYAWMRADWTHFTPLFLTSVAAVSMLIGAKRLPPAYLGLAIFCLLPTYSFLKAPIPNSATFDGSGLTRLAGELADCRRVLQENVKARSVFVGRASYDLYILNIVALYLAAERLSPASRFIVEDPGLQSSCDYGGVIRNELLESPKPLLVFLDGAVQRAEPNATRTMSSCHKIEDFLQTAPFHDGGACRAFGVPFQVRLYD